MKKILIILIFLSTLYFANSYEGLYFDTNIGLNARLLIDSVSFITANPYSSKATANTNIASDFNFDIGYTFYKLNLNVCIPEGIKFRAL